MVCKDTLRIKHLPKELSDAQKEDFVLHFGASKVKVITSKAKAKSIVYAKFENEDVAKNVMSRLHQITVLNSRLSVEYAETDILHGQLAAHKVEDARDGPDKRFFKHFINGINAFNDSVGFYQPPPSHLKYNYPKANRATINNIAHALATVPRFYTQVLHLMNKMNLPPPFAMPEPPVRTIPGGQQLQPPNIFQNAEKMSAKRKVQSSSESELESDGEGNKTKEIIPEKKPVPKKKLIKRPKFIKQSPAQPSINSKPAEKTENIFEKVTVQSQKKIELKVSQDQPSDDTDKPIDKCENIFEKVSVLPEQKIDSKGLPAQASVNSKPVEKTRGILNSKPVEKTENIFDEKVAVQVPKEIELKSIQDPPAEKSEPVKAKPKGKLTTVDNGTTFDVKATQSATDSVKPAKSIKVTICDKKPDSPNLLEKKIDHVPPNHTEIPEVKENIEKQQFAPGKPKIVPAYVAEPKSNPKSHHESTLDKLKDIQSAIVPDLDSALEKEQTDQIIIQKQIEVSCDKLEFQKVQPIDQSRNSLYNQEIIATDDNKEKEPQLHQEPVSTREEKLETPAEPETEDEFPCISLEELAANQVTDLTVMPVFKNYNSGEPTNKLYIKNCAKTVVVQDLEYIYNRYREECTGGKPSEFNIRLMQEGRMKGQAFVTLDSVEQAQRAVKETNGFILKDKPLVVVFGKAGKKK